MGFPEDSWPLGTVVDSEALEDVQLCRATPGNGSGSKALASIGESCPANSLNAGRQCTDMRTPNVIFASRSQFFLACRCDSFAKPQDAGLVVPATRARGRGSLSLFLSVSRCQCAVMWLHRCGVVVVMAVMVL